MEGSRVLEVDHLDDSVYSDADLTSHLRDKIRQQAARLRNLEQYRILCEKRILELCPGHPLPVKEEHKATHLSASQELQLARDKIQRLESQLSHQALDTEELKDQSDYILLLEKYNDMLKDKTDLEESLRAEMLNCEEQRTYIDLLKQTIEGKLEEMDGISLDPKALSIINHSKSRVDDSRREQSRMKNALLDYESQLKRLSHKLKTRENENEMLVKEREELDSHLRQAAEALQIAEEEVAKLEEEKNSMLEYLGQSTSKEREMERELNELGSYFEQMKKDFHETLKDLEIMKSKEAKQDAENEVHKEEIFRTSQQYGEMSVIMDGLKKTVGEKESMVKVLREEKMTAELRIEKLQANVNSLTESLKEIQINSTKLQEQLDVYTKQDMQKVENNSRLKSEHMSLYQENIIFKEKLQVLNRELENSKKSQNDLERIRELDIKQIQDFKAKLLEYQAKSEIFEGYKRVKDENDQSRRTEQNRILQLEEEIQYLTESLREIQHREVVISKNFNEAKILNTKLSNQLEELYLENDSYRIELEKKIKEVDLYISKFNHLNDYYESIESDKQELQELLNSEKSYSKLYKDQYENEKIKYEEVQKTVDDKEKSKIKAEKILEEKEEELQKLKKNLKNLEREMEDEKHEKSKKNFEAKEKSGRVELLENEQEKFHNEVSNCCKLISAFCGKLTIVYNDYRSCLSSGYKDFLDCWTEGNTLTLENITSWVVNTIEEVQSLSKALFQISKQYKQATNDMSKFQSLLDDSSTNETIYKQHAIKLKNELEELYRKNEAIIEQSEEEIHNLRFEITSLKHEIMSLTSDKYSLTEALRSALTESSNLKLSNDYSSKNTRSEKMIYSREALVKQVQRDLALSREELGKSEGSREQARKNMICTREHSPSTCPYLHLNSSQKSQFS